MTEYNDEHWLELLGTIIDRIGVDKFEMFTDTVVLMKKAESKWPMTTPYPNCRRPAECILKGYCVNDPACFN